ncbi:MAG: branched-chain amino acid ABC transporter substrate-binding protein [Planctomycetes bacterium]|nr:branched-chain amino acid ABC transporter substrate-binding protein [Planctomycetota bacterium]
MPRSLSFALTALAVVLLAALAVLPLTPARAGDDVIKIGVAGPLTGGQAKMGNDVLHGVQLAVKEWNAKGGVLGKKIEVISRDDEAQEKQATPCARELVNEGAVGVIGHFNSGCTIPASEVYYENMVPMITPSATNPKVTDRAYENVFRVCGRDDQQGGVAARFTVETLKAKKVAILHDKTAYGQGLADEFKKGIINALGEAAVVYYAGFSKDEVDFRAILTATKEKAPDMWFFGGIYNQAGPMVKQARQIGLTAPFMSGDGVIDQEFLKTADKDAEGSYLTFGPDPERLPGAKAFLAAYHADYGDHGPYSIYAYDAANILLTAITNAKSADGKKVCDALHAIEYEGAIGKTQFDKKGDIVGSYYVLWIVKDGKFVLYENK